eukprot:3050819-Pleurochrysis_carterae.AAC.2
MQRRRACDSNALTSGRIRFVQDSQEEGAVTGASWADGSGSEHNAEMTGVGATCSDPDVRALEGVASDEEWRQEWPEAREGSRGAESDGRRGEELTPAGRGTKRAIERQCCH